MENAHHSKLTVAQKLRLMAEMEQRNKARWKEFAAKQAASKKN